jgi:hypothetical protein
MNNIRSLLNGSCDLDLIIKDITELHKVNILILDLINTINKQLYNINKKIIENDNNNIIINKDYEEIKKVLEILINKYNLHSQLLV